MKNNSNNDTIAAQATPPGRGGVGVIRISGARVPALAEILLGKLPEPRTAVYAKFYDATGALLDEGLVLYFKAPHSFTGEEVLELQVHGSPIVLDLLLRRIFELGARPAEAGEFSKRAFLNGKIDLTQAEAIADLINATSIAAAKAAERSLQGDFSKQVNALKEALVKIRLQIEAAIDFTEEELDLKSRVEIEQELGRLLLALKSLLGTAEQGVLLQEGVTIVLAGAPNVGKSSLLNALAGQDAAIVTPYAGTTRDVLREIIDIDGLPLKILDTAGLRESADPIEQEGIKRAGKAILAAEHVLLLIDAAKEDERDFAKLRQRFLTNLTQILGAIGVLLPTDGETVLAAKKVTLVFNKIDLTKEAPAARLVKNGGVIYLSAKDGLGLPLLRHYLKQSVGYESNVAVGFSARQRHIVALQEAQAALLAAKNRLLEANAFDLLAEELRLAQQALATITGEFSNEDLLTRIFSEFCIGK